MAVPEDARGGHRRAAHADRQLGPGRPDRARQRAGHRRPRLALGRAGREARDPRLLPEDHQVRRRAARRPCAPACPAGPSASRRCRRTGSARATACASPSCTTSAAPTDAPIQDGKLFVFTTRADTIMGVTFCAVAPEHPLARHAAAGNPALAEAIGRWTREQAEGGTSEVEAAKRKAKGDDKEGMPTGLFVTHPLTHEPVEVWVANYVLMGYGDGAVMGVPAHDERDFAFAKKYRIPILQVIADRRRARLQLRPLAGLVRLQGRGRRARGDDQLRLLQRPAPRRRRRRHRARARDAPRRRAAHHLAAARLGHQPPALLGHADPDHPLRRRAARCRCPRRTCRWCCPRT